MSSGNRVVDAVHQLATVLAATKDVDDILRRTLEVALSKVDSEGGSILLHDAQSRELCFRYVVGGRHGHAQPTLGMTTASIPDDKGFAGQVFHSRVPRIENDVQNNVEHEKQIDADHQFLTRSVATVPLCFPGGEVVGVVQLVNKRNGGFDEEDLTVLGVLASIAALSVVLRSAA